MKSTLLQQVSRLKRIVRTTFSFRDEDFDAETIQIVSKGLWSALNLIPRDLLWNPDAFRVDMSSSSVERAQPVLSNMLDELEKVIEYGLTKPDSIRIQETLETLADVLESSAGVVSRASASKAAHPYSILRGGTTIAIVGRRGERSTSLEDGPDRISVAMYIDGDDAAVRAVMRRVDTLVGALGYGKPIDEQIENGSIFRRYFAILKRAFTSRDARENLVKAERALELLTIDVRQAQVDEKVAAAVSGLVDSFEDVPRACVRVGSIFFVKYLGPSGAVVLARNLSQVEIRAMERFPEIQREPEKAFEALALAVAQLEGPESSQLP
jgi:hypothetical protein